MRLEVSSQTVHAHTDLVSALGWNHSNELFTASDDHTIQQWNSQGQLQTKVTSQNVQSRCCRNKIWRHCCTGLEASCPLSDELLRCQQVCSIEAYFTDIHWYPVNCKGQQGGGGDVFAVACTDGEDFFNPILPRKDCKTGFQCFK